MSELHKEDSVFNELETRSIAIRFMFTLNGFRLWINTGDVYKPLLKWVDNLVEAKHRRSVK